METSTLPPSKLMEDHRDAYFFWKELGIRNAVCVHVDAHLDVSNFKVPHYDLDTPEVNCANFLFHACQQGIVEHNIWVIPPHLRAGSSNFLEWAQLELQRWMNLTVTEYASLREEQGRVVGMLAGARLTLCELESLPPMEPERPLLVDIDIDYFLDPKDDLWQNPLQLREALEPIIARAQALTVAYSVKGGYTPLRQRYLGDLTLLAHQGQKLEANRLWELFNTPQILSDASAPVWLRAAALIGRAWRQGEDHQGSAWDEAAALDPAYRVDPSNVAGMYQIRKNVERCNHWLEKEASDVLGRHYLAGFSAFRDDKLEVALQEWGALLAHPQCPPGGNTRSHVLELCGRAQQKLARFSQAEESFRAALTLDPKEPSLWRELARAQSKQGNDEDASRSYRKSLSLAPDDLAGLEVRLELAQLYQKLGQVALGQAECRRIQASQAPSAFKDRADLLAWRLSRALK